MAAGNELSLKDKVILQHMTHELWSPIAAVHRNLEEANWDQWTRETTGNRIRHLADLGLVERDDQRYGFYRITPAGIDVAMDLEMPKQV
jgi:RIO-like serine/threonine protein kinase